MIFSDHLCDGFSESVELVPGIVDPFLHIPATSFDLDRQGHRFGLEPHGFGDDAGGLGGGPLLVVFPGR